jgi:beta-lactamase regulating signal transducer with metallopeptidase domain
VAPEAPSRIAEVLLLVWLCGLVAVVYYWVAAWLNIRAAVRRSKPLDIDLPIPCSSLDVRATEAVLEPCVFGLLHPVLVVPATMKARLSADEWNAVLVHEASHIQRRDNLTGAVHMVVETLFWFYPLVWRIGEQLIKEREQACDEAVVRLMGNPEAYASGILNVCKFYMESRLASSPGVAGSNLRKRIEGIMANHTIEELNKPKRLLFLAAGVMAVVLPISAGMVGPVSRIGFQNGGPKAFEVASIKLNK